MPRGCDDVMACQFDLAIIAWSSQGFLPQYVRSGGAGFGNVWQG